jgi:hypothetical protein
MDNSRNETLTADEVDPRPSGTANQTDSPDVRDEDDDKAEDAVEEDDSDESSDTAAEA